MTAPFTPDETRRYARHLVLRGLGGTGQQQLKAAKVVVVGLGALGSPVIAYLAAAGIGTLGLCDDDRVGLANLQSQILHTTAALTEPKVASAERFTAALNPHVTVLQHPLRLTPENAAGILAPYDIVVDATDNFAARGAIADAARALEKPVVSGAVSGFDGQVTVYLPGGTGFRDLYPEPLDDADLPTCEAVGLFSPSAGVIGTLMAAETLKLVTGNGQPIAGRLLLYDGRGGRFTEMAYGPA